MTGLNTQPNIARPDDLYEALIGLTQGIDETASLKTQAKLILLLANHIGDAGIVGEAIGLARTRSATPNQ